MFLTRPQLLRYVQNKLIQELGLIFLDTSSTSRCVAGNVFKNCPMFHLVIFGGVVFCFNTISNFQLNRALHVGVQSAKKG